MTELIDKNELLKNAVMISGPSGKSTYSVVFADDITNTKAIEYYTKADLVAMLIELQLEIKKLWDNRYDVWLDNQYYIGKDDTLEEVDEVIQQKIDSLKENT